MNAFFHANLGITDFWTFLLGTIFIVILPGPNSMYVLSVAAQRGVKPAYQGAGGIFLGDLILMVLSACGVASLLKASPALFYVVKYIGAAYLAAVTATGAAGLVSLDYSCLLHLQGLGVPAARDLKFYHLAEILMGDG